MYSDKCTPLVCGPYHSHKVRTDNNYKTVLQGESVRSRRCSRKMMFKGDDGPGKRRSKEMVLQEPGIPRRRCSRKISIVPRRLLWEDDVPRRRCSRLMAFQGDVVIRRQSSREMVLQGDRVPGRRCSKIHFSYYIVL